MKHLFVAATLIALPVAAFADEPAADSLATAQLVERVLERTNFDAALRTLQGGTFRGGLGQAPPQVRALVMDALEPTQLRAAAVGYLAETTEEAEVRRVLDWMERPLVARMVAIDSSSAGPDFEAGMQAYFAQLEPAALDTARIVVAQRLSDVSGLPQRMSAFSYALMWETAQLTNALVPDDQHLTPEQLQQTMAPVRALLQQQFAQYGPLHFYYVYRDVPVADLAAYADALDSPPGRWYYGATFEALAHAIEGAIAGAAG